MGKTAAKYAAYSGSIPANGLGVESGRPRSFWRKLWLPFWLLGLFWAEERGD